MAWSCTARSHLGLIANLRTSGLISTQRVESAMKAVDRAHYVAVGAPYQDSPQPIGFGATISAPHMHAEMLERLEPFLKPGNKALDVGSGSGYLSACMAHMVTEGGAKGKVVGIEHISELTDLATKSLQEDCPDFLTSGTVELKVGDGRKGWAAEAPYDAIHVGAASPEIPKELLEQLKPGGRMIIPVGPENGDQYLVQVDKDANNKVSMTKVTGVRFVPLTSEEHQRGSSRARIMQSAW
jgi:protein-L-isoaspartate(D-aspartate) O-methyltransferase